MRDGGTESPIIPLVKWLATALVALTLACTAAAPPSASSTVPPSASSTGVPGSVPTVGASPTAAAATSPARVTLDDRYGWIVTGPAAGGSASEVWIRPEADPQKRTPISGAMFTASPDGAQVASWRASPSGESTDLVVFPAADPSQARSIYKVPTGQRGAWIVWASDGSGLLVTHQGVDPRTESLVSIDLRASNTAVTLGTLTGGRGYVAIAWDRVADLIAAAETTVFTGGAAAPNLESYLTIKPGPTPSAVRTLISERIPSPRIAGSPDGKWAYGISADGVRTWPTSNYSAGTTFQPAGQTSLLLWRPGTTQLVWVNSRDRQLETYDVATKAATVLARGLQGDPASSSTPSMQAVRFDGSAAIVGDVQGGTGWILVDLNSGASIPIERGTAFSNGLIASVRLR